MPHQCLKCESVFDNTSDVIIKGCPNCGAKLFLYIKKAPEKEAEFELSQDQKDIILKEVESFVDIKETEVPIILKLENIRVLAPGKYEIDINQLMKKDKPLIYKIQEGTYVIDIDFLRGVESKNGK